MYCTKCGKDLYPGTKICTVCGQRVESFTGSQFNNQFNGNAFTGGFSQNTNGYFLTNRIFIRGMISIILSIFATIPFIGIVFGILSLVDAKNYQKQFGSLVGKAKTGKILAIVGIVLGAITTILTIYFYYLQLTGQLDLTNINTIYNI